MPSPELFPPAALGDQKAFRLRANLWRTEYGSFLHQGDGNRVLIVVEEEWQAVLAERCARALGYVVQEI